MATFISFMKSPNHWKCSNRSKLKLKINSIKGLQNVRSDRGGEYYGKYDGSGEQRPRLFAKFLEECDIVP